VHATFACAYFVLAVVGLITQVGAQERARANADTLKTPVTVYRAGHEITAPVLITPDFPDAVTSDCHSRKSGKVVLQTVVDERGILHNISFVKATATDLDRLAVQLASLDRFTPAKKDNTPVAVGEKIEIKIDGCLEKPAGNTPAHFALASPPIQRVTPSNNFPDQVIFATDSAPSDVSSSTLDSSNSPSAPGGSYRTPNGISAPIPIYQPQAEYSDEARDRHISGEVLIKTVIDIHGLPQHPRVVRPLGAGLDSKALEAVMRYRFKPAMKDGIEPVAITVTIQVNFRLER